MPDRRRRPTSTVPFGWRLCTDPQYIEPVEAEQDALMAALGYLDLKRSLREVARWLATKTGRTISPTGLRKIWIAHKEHRLG